MKLIGADGRSKGMDASLNVVVTLVVVLMVMVVSIFLYNSGEKDLKTFNEDKKDLDIGSIADSSANGEDTDGSGGSGSGGEDTGGSGGEGPSGASGSFGPGDDAEPPGDEWDGG